jgi:hypothetical protein
MDDSVFRIVVLPICSGVLAGLVIGFVLFQLIESVGRLFARVGSSPAPRTAATCGACDAPRCEMGAEV